MLMKKTDEKQQEQRPTEDLQQTDSSRSHIGPGRSTLYGCCQVSGLRPGGTAGLVWSSVSHLCSSCQICVFLLSLS